MHSAEELSAHTHLCKQMELNKTHSEYSRRVCGVFICKIKAEQFILRVRKKRDKLRDIQKWKEEEIIFFLLCIIRFWQEELCAELSLSSN